MDDNRRTLIFCRECGACWEAPYRSFAVAHCHPNQQSFVSFIYETERARAHAWASSVGADLSRLVML